MTIKKTLAFMVTLGGICAASESAWINAFDWHFFVAYVLGAVVAAAMSYDMKRRLVSR